MALVALLAFGVGNASAQELPMSRGDVEEGLTCQCGCGLTVHACNHLQCSFAIPVRKDIAESLERGETGQQILDRYAQKYGEKVLSSPIATGFNVLAWIAPYVAVAVGGILIVFAIRRMAHRSAELPHAAPDEHSSDPASQQQLARLREEIEEFER